MTADFQCPIQKHCPFRQWCRPCESCLLLTIKVAQDSIATEFAAWRNEREETNGTLNEILEVARAAKQIGRLAYRTCIGLGLLATAALAIHTLITSVK